MNYIETIKVVDGQILNLVYHQERVRRTIGKGDYIPTEVPKYCNKGIFKYRIVYNKAGIIDINFAQYSLPKITSLKLIECNDIDYHFKYENRTRLNELKSLKGECDDVLIIKDNKVSDTNFCNIVFENNEGLFTPSSPLLKGTKRASLIKNKVITEKLIKRNDIQKYNHAYLINAMIDLGEVKIDIKNIKEEQLIN